MAMPRSKKMGAAWAKTRRNPRSAATRKPSRSGNVLLALRSESREKKPTTETRPPGAATAAKSAGEVSSGNEPLPAVPAAAAVGGGMGRVRGSEGSGGRRRRRRRRGTGRGGGRRVERSGASDLDRTAEGSP
uniref:Uncharacterized protein n=1 Tax=Arundo donax TaxID=35708 RepID=A0A0A9DDQ4_ARUDO